MNQKMSSYDWITILLIINLNVFGTHAGCYWNTLAPGTECNMYCINETPASIDDTIMAKVNERQNCTNSITLSLRSQSYPNSTIPAYFVNASIKVIDLDVSFLGVNAISVDAFASPAFGSVRKLIFSNFGIQLIPNGMLNGMNALEIFNIMGAGGIMTIENGVLDSVTELKEFTFEQSLRNNPTISINALTGSKELPKLEYVQVRYKLANTVRQSTFTALTNVKILDLSSCQIEFLGANSFDPISNSIELLNLQGNLLTTLPVGLFDMILPKNGLVINLSENNWYCDCELMPFRTTLEQFKENFIRPIICVTSGDCIGSNLLESECFNECENQSTSSTQTSISPTQTTTSEATTITTTSPEEYLQTQCFKPNESQFSDTVVLKRPSNYLTIAETGNGEVNLNINSEDTSLVVVWFSGNQGSNSGSNKISVEYINCISQDESASIPIHGLKPNVVYTFCLMDKFSGQVSPLDCITYVKSENESNSVSLLQSSRTITLVVITFMLNVVSGL